jgi:hypothetical protein
LTLEKIGVSPNVPRNSPMPMHAFVNINTPNELDNIASSSSLFIESLMVLCNLVHYKLKLANDKVERLILMLKKSKLKSHLAQHNFLHAK